MSIDLRELQNLPVAEKLEIVEFLWDDIGSSDEPLLLQPWHLDEARARLNELQTKPEILLTRDELWRQVKIAT